MIPFLAALIIAFTVPESVIAIDGLDRDSWSAVVGPFDEQPGAGSIALNVTYENEGEPSWTQPETWYLHETEDGTFEYSPEAPE